MNKIPEWARISARILRLWPHQTIPDDTLDEWYLLLRHLDAAAVDAAVTALAEREFAPPPGLIRAKAADLVDPPVTFEQAWAEIARAVSAAGRYQPARAELMLRQVPGAWDLVLSLGGWNEVCHGGPIEQPPMLPGVRRAAGEHAWLVLREQRRTDIAAATLPGSAGAAARERLEGDAVRRIAQDPDRPLAVAGLTAAGAVEVTALPGRPRLASIVGPRPAGYCQKLLPAPGRPAPAVPAAMGNGLKPEYRRGIEELIRSGREDQVPERWRSYVPEIKAAMSTAAAQIPQPQEV